MDILGKARKLELKIARRFDESAKDVLGSNAREPIEIVHAIVGAVEQQIQSGGRGRRVFPYNHVAVSVLASSRDARARFEAVFAGEPSLRDRIFDRLRSAGCNVVGLTVDIAYVARSARTWNNPHFHIAFDRVTQVAAKEPAADPEIARIELTVMRGTASHRTYSFIGQRIDLGRCAEVRDSRNRLIRTNHVAFTEGSGDVNQSVSRRHGHIAYQPNSSEYRLHDDGSVHGTDIVRSGRTIPVPSGSRGVRLLSGDEVMLGEARLRIRIEVAERTPV